MSNDPNYNPLGQERYDELARQQTKAQGLPGPDGTTADLTGAVSVLSGMYSVSSVLPGITREITRYTFAAGELNPSTDVIAMQIWPTTNAVDASGVWDPVQVYWNNTYVFGMPASDVSGYCWYVNMTQFSNNSNADTLLIDPGPTPGFGPRPIGPQYNSVALGSNWMEQGGSLVFRVTNNSGTPVGEARLILKIWKITPAGVSS
jgi:hypothetical protein